MRSTTILSILFLLVVCAQPAVVQPAQGRSSGTGDRGTILFVPLDDRPVTRQLPAELARIAGRPLTEPPQALLGNYLHFGDPDAIIAWLHRISDGNAGDGNAYVLSSDMLAYGGLVASRVPGTTYADAYFRLRVFQQVRRAHPVAWISAFGTIMRLAPTGVPAIGDASHFFAAYPVWTYLQEYANLHAPLLSSEVLHADRLRTLIGDVTLHEYLDTRARNYGVDVHLLDLTRERAINQLVLGQDDAGPVGLHITEVHQLQYGAAQIDEPSAISIEPGTDELGMALVANALTREIHWIPRVAVRYSAPNAFSYQDPREYAPVPETIEHVITLCGGVHDDANPDSTLYVRLPYSNAREDEELLDAMSADEAAGKSIAFADLTFLENNYASQAAFAEHLLQTGVASRLDAYASWNTNANTVGTALAEAIAAGAGRRAGTYNVLAHREFTFSRFLDDYAFHDYVRPELNAMLDAEGVTDHTYLLPEVAARAATYNFALLWQRAPRILAQLYPTDHITAMQITLPWNRTFETEIDVRLAPTM